VSKLASFILFNSLAAFGAGGLEKAVVNDTMAKNSKALRACYEEALKIDPKLQGTVTLSFRISPDGAVSDGAATSSTLTHLGTQECLVQAVEAIKFPKSSGETKVGAYPLKLSPYQESVFTHKKKNPMVKDK